MGRMSHLNPESLEAEQRYNQRRKTDEPWDYPEAMRKH